MEKSRRTTRIWFGLMAMALISSLQGVISMPCNCGTNDQNGNAMTSVRPVGKGTKSDLAAGAMTMVATSTPSAIKKDLFMSRGWGASGMPFSMFYLNHYSKAQKAYAQNQLQQQQLQQQQERQQQERQKLELQKLQDQQIQNQQQQQQKQQMIRIEQQQVDASLKELQEDATNTDSENVPVPETPSSGNRYDSEAAAGNAQQLRIDADYVDSASAVRTSKVNTSRRQYTVPQLFVSYGWGPMG